MVIETLRLERFRNYPSLEVSFPRNPIVFVGRNGQGKTNLVEALYLLTHLRSFRSPDLDPLIQQGESQAFLQADLKKKQVGHQVKIALFKAQKRVWLDEKPLGLGTEYIRQFTSLLFSPASLNAYAQDPAEKRAFFDRNLSLLEPHYIERLKEYNHIRKNRNILLKQRDVRQLQAWDELLCQKIPPLVQAREQLVQRVNQGITHEFQQLTGRSETLTLHYKSDLQDKTPLEPASLARFFSEKRPQELESGHQQYGPQKDRFWMTLGGKKDKVMFSQGEQRTAFLALLFCMEGILKTTTGFAPVLLLDDLFSELDAQVTAKLVARLHEADRQSFTTTTQIPPSFAGRVFEVSQGQLVL